MKRAGVEGATIVRRDRGRAGPLAVAAPSGRRAEEVVTDPFRAVIFPNRVREQRQRAGFPKLMALAGAIPAIPYIRLSKIERGEVVARADELVRIAERLGIAPNTLLLDVDAAGFDLAAWAEPFMDDAVDTDEERFAVMVAAALRVRRQGDRSLTLAVLDDRFGLPPVLVSRLENAQKPFGRWNTATRDAVCRLLGAADEGALRRAVVDQYRDGKLDAFVDGIADPAARLARTRERIAALAAELVGTLSPQQEAPAMPEQSPIAAAPERTAPPAESTSRRMLTVFGAPLPDGLIAATPTSEQIEAPAAAGSRAFALRVCRATLGGGLPAHATVVVDPERFPAPGGLAAVREGAGYRLLAITQDRHGVTQGYSVSPDMDVSIDALDPADVAAVIAASFV